MSKLKVLLRSIEHYNQIARASDGEISESAHKKCQSSVLKLAKADFGNITDTMKTLSEIPAEIGCESCKDTFDYAHACLNGDHRTAKDIEIKYGIAREGSILLNGDIAYVKKVKR